MKPILALASLLFYLSAGAQTSPKNYSLVWSDEFDYNGLPDSTKWSYDTGGDGWGNQELEFYTHADTANAVVRDGYLHITGRRSNGGRNPYTSGPPVCKGTGAWLF